MCASPIQWHSTKETSGLLASGQRRYMRACCLENCLSVLRRSAVGMRTSIVPSGVLGYFRRDPLLAGGHRVSQVIGWMAAIRCVS